MRQNPLMNYVFTIGGGEIAWKSVKQSIIDRSIMEQKFIAMELASSEVDWLRSLIANIPLGIKPTLVVT